METTDSLFVGAQVSVDNLVDRIQQHSGLCSDKLKLEAFAQRGHVAIIVQSNCVGTQNKLQHKCFLHFCTR